MKYKKLIIIILVIFIIYKINYRIENYVPLTVMNAKKVKDKYYSNYWNKPIALVNVVQNNNKEMILNLLSLGYDVNFLDEKGRSAIFYCRDVEIFNKLISFGAKIHIKDDLGQSLLQYYCSNYTSLGFGDYKNSDKESIKNIIEIILSLGGDPNISNDKDEYPLTYVLKSPYCDQIKKISKLLISYGADCKVKDINNKTLIMIAAKNKKCNTIEIIKILINMGCDLFAVDNFGNNALFYACETENIKLIKFLLSKGLDPKLVNKENMNVLNNTIKNGTRNIKINSEIINLLISHGANHDHIDYRYF